MVSQLRRTKSDPRFVFGPEKPSFVHMHDPDDPDNSISTPPSTSEGTCKGRNPALNA